MSAENKALSRRLLEEAFNAGNTDVVDELVATDFVNHDSALPEPTVGQDAAKASIQGYRAAFPDLRLTIEEQIAGDDLVATRWSAKGTQEGELMGMARDGQAGDCHRDHDRQDRGRPHRRELDELGHARDAAAARRRSGDGHGLRAKRGGVAFVRPLQRRGVPADTAGTSRDVSLASPPPAHALPRMRGIGRGRGARPSHV